MRGTTPEVRGTLVCGAAIRELGVLSYGRLTRVTARVPTDRFVAYSARNTNDLSNLTAH